jgi:RNA polymerase sigma-70 factor (ECF subfamily)
MSSSTATSPPTADFGELEQYRRELAGYCYRMLGSAFEADDAVQDTMVRAWKALDRFEGRSSLRSWLYRIATNVCLDLLNGRNRRALPMDLGPASPPDISKFGAPLAESAWVEPVPSARVLPASADPGDLAVERETVRLAFVAALQHLPARQRAVLILREVLRLKADEVAELLDTTVASVNSALQRARANLDGLDVGEEDGFGPELDDTHRALLDRYVDAFERYDIDALTELLHEDAIASMPPYDFWLRGRDDIGAWQLGPGAECRGSRVLRVEANGTVALAQYRPSGPGGRHEPWALHLLRITGGRIAEITYFLDTGRLFPLFGLPRHPDD